MIRFQCPTCDKRLNVPDSKGGAIGVCPGCQTRIRIPNAPEPDPDLVDDLIVDEPAPKAQAKASPVRRKEDMPPLQRRRTVEDDDDEPPRHKRRPVEDEDDEEDIPEAERADEDDEPVRKKRKKKKKKRRQSSALAMFGGLDPYLMALIIVALLGVLSVIPALIFPPAFLVPLIVGGLVAAVGRIWFLMVAFQDDTTQGMLCLWFGLYSLVYLAMNFEEAKRPFFLEVLGFVIVVLGFCAGGIGGGMNGG